MAKNYDQRHHLILSIVKKYFGSFLYFSSVAQSFLTLTYKLLTTVSVRKEILIPGMAKDNLHSVRRYTI